MPKTKPKHVQRPTYRAHRVLTQRQLYALARSAGLSPARAALASAVAMAESGGKVDAVSRTGDLGAWQINHAAHPQYDTHRLVTDPAYNAKAMAEISSHGKSWGAWTTFTSGAYRKYMHSVKELKGAKAPRGGGIPAGSSPATGAGSGKGLSAEAANAIASREAGLPGTRLVAFPFPPLFDPRNPGDPNALPEGIGPHPGLNNIPGIGNPLGGAEGAVANLFPQQIQDFFSLLNNLFTPEFWFKVGKVLLGILAIAWGVNALVKASTGVSPAGAVRKAATTAAAAAAA